MNAIFLALFVVAVTAIPVPEDISGSDAVEMIVNGLPDGVAFGASNMFEFKLKEHVGGEVVTTDLLHPYSAVGIAEAAAAASAVTPNDVSVVDSDTAEFARNLHPMPIVIPSPGFEPIQIPKPVIPVPIVMPPPAVPVVDDKPEQLPIAAPQLNNDVYNDGHVQVQYNGPEEPGNPGMLSTLQDWFQVVVNYFSKALPESSAPAVDVYEPKQFHIHHH